MSKETVKKETKILYIVNAYKHGDRELHSYTIGVFNKKHKAQAVAESHAEYRGGKYACVVEECILDMYDENSIYTRSIYRVKSSMELYNE